MPLSSRQSTLLLFSVFVIAICGLIYELIIGTLSSYLFGNSVVYFSLTIGLFMSAMGVGSYASRWITRSLLGWFILLEIAIGLAGGVSAALLYAVFATTPYYHIAMVLLTFLVGGMVGMEIPILTRLSSSSEESIKDALANVLAFDYLGALIASVLFPLLLLPELGVLKTAFVTGLLNMAVVFLNLHTFRDRLRQWRQLLGVSVTVTLLLLAGTAWSFQLTSFFEMQLYEDAIIYTQQTRYQRIVMTRWGEDVRLFLDGNLQFSTRDEYRYHEPLVHPALSLTRSRESILILGGGDGLAVREILKYEDVQPIELVDIDPAMTELANSHPVILAANEGALMDPRVELVHQDAFKYLEEGAEQFGVIIIDLPDPNNESLGKLYTREFYKMVRRHLAGGGVVAVQATSPYFARETFWCIVHTAADAGFQTWPYHTYIPSFGDWGFFLATAHPIEPEAFTVQVPMRYLTPEVLAGSFIFDSDTSEVETKINTLDSQVVLRYYEKGWKQWGD
ncbi:MAG: polyamine aminopropyltransferase [Ardenticatenales bacterium]|nr:polyamine aminopropyltransferase [Ardenticatenales bacterium]